MTTVIEVSKFLIALSIPLGIICVIYYFKIGEGKKLNSEEMKGGKE